MNNRRRAAFILALVMIFSSLPIWGGDVYASVLAEEDKIIVSETADEVLETEDILISEYKDESNKTNEKILEKPQDTLDPEVIKNDHTDKLDVTTDDNGIVLDGVNKNSQNREIHEDSTVFEQDEVRAEGLRPRDEYEVVVYYDIIVGQSFPCVLYQWKQAEGLENIEITGIPDSGLSYIKGKKVGYTGLEYYD